MTKDKSKSKKRKRKPAWRVMVPGGKILPSMTLEQLRAMKDSHAYLTQTFAGPPALGAAIRAFRFLEMFGAACVVENKFPALSRCHQDLDALFGKDPAFEGDMLIPSWTLLDFPCGPQDRTALDHFEHFLEEAGRLAPFKPFIDAARPSRLGLYQSGLRSAQTARFSEIFTRRVVDVVPSFDAGEPGELILGRLMEIGGQIYFWGDVKVFPADRLGVIENMVLDKLLDAGLLDEDPAPMYERFMKQAGPYWMSIVASNERLPILDPDHYLNYLP